MSGFKVNFSVNNQLSTPSIHAAPFAQRPAAGQPGRVFIDSDNPSTGIYRDTGTTWVVIGMPSSPEADTLQIVTNRGNTTTNSITVGAATTPSGTVDVRRSTAALNGTNDWAFLGVNTPTIPSGASFGVNYVNAVYGSQAQTFAGNATIGNAGLNSAGNFINTLSNSASGTITVAQGSGTIRAIAGLHAGIYYNTPNAMTFTHVAGIRTLQPINSGAVGASVTNYYGIHVADSTPASGTISYTNRYGIYQEGASDPNYFAGNVGINAPTISNPIGTDYSILHIRGRSASATGAIFLNNDDNTIRSAIFQNSSNLTISAISAQNMTFSTSNVERMRIVGSNGNVLVGKTTDNGVKFQVQGGIDATGAIGCNGQMSCSFIATGTTFSNVVEANTGNMSIRTNIGSSRTISFGDAATNLTATEHMRFFPANTIPGIGTGSIDLIINKPTINQTSGTGNIYGFRFNPTNTAVLSTVWAFYADSGRTYLNDVLSIGSTTPDASALMQINSTTKGFLGLPRMTDAQITAITTPANGLMAYSTDQNCPAFYDGTGWRKISHSAL